MKNLKRLMSVVLSVIMLMSFIVSTSAATFADVAETDDAYEAVEVLAALKILEGKEAGNFDPEGNIKRSEMAAIICRARNAENAALGSASFTDVSADHWAFNYIGWAASEQIINGRGDGTFDPDANVTYSEAIAMIIRALGYEWYVTNFLNGFPTGYARIANTYKIDKGVGVSNGNAAATRADVAMLLYNAFDAPLMDVKYISFEPEYVIYDGSKSVDYEKRTLLSYYSDIYKVKATVDNTYKNDTSLIGSNGDKKMAFTAKSLYGFDEIDVEDALNMTISNTNTFSAIANNDDWAAYQGYTVNAYITVNEKEKAEVVAMVADNSSVEELVIANASELVVESTIDGSGNVTLEYYENADDSKTNDVKLTEAKNVDLYVNSILVGNLAGAGAAEFESLDDGYYSSVTLLGSDGEFNKIYLVSYQYGIVEEVDVEGEVIETTGDSYYLSADDTSEDFVYNIYKDGVKIELSDLAEGDLLNIVIGEANGDISNATFVDIYVTNDVIESSIKYTNKNGAYNIDGTDYYLAANNNLSKGLKAGDTGSFYITIDGYIYDAEFASTYSDNYAFILDVGSNASGFGETWQVKLLDKNNTERVLNVKSSVYITDANNDRVAYKSESGASKAQSTYFNALDAKLEVVAADKAAALVELSKYVAERMVTYKETDGQITELVFAQSFTGSDRDFCYETLNGKYGEKTGMLDGKELVDNNVLFNVPLVEDSISENSGIYMIKADAVQVYSASGLKNDKAYKGFFYNVDDEANTFGAAILTDKMAFAGATNALAVVVSVSTGLNSDSETADLVKFTQGGETFELYISNNSYDGFALKNASAGDVFQYSVNGAGDINKAELVFDYVAGGQSDLVAVNEDDVEYYAGLVEGNTAKVLTLDCGSFAWDMDEASTNVLFDTDKAKSPISPRTSTSYIKKYDLNKNTGNFSTDAYVAVVRTVDDVVVDVVTYVYDRPAMDVATFVATYLK